MARDQPGGERWDDQEPERDDRSGGRDAERDGHAHDQIEESVPDPDALPEHERELAVERDEEQLLPEGEQRDDDHRQDHFHDPEARRRGGEDVTLEQIHHLRVTVRIVGEEEDRERRRRRVRETDPRIDGLSAAPLERRQQQQVRRS